MYRGIRLFIHLFILFFFTKIRLTMPRVKMSRADRNPWLAKMIRHKPSYKQLGVKTKRTSFVPTISGYAGRQHNLTKYLYLKWQWIFYLFSKCFLSSINALPSPLFPRKTEGAYCSCTAGYEIYACFFFNSLLCLCSANSGPLDNNRRGP
jgi:hypothetical protein